MNVGRAASWASLALAMTSLGAHAASPPAGSGSVPLAQGVAFTTTTHAALQSTSAGLLTTADTETVYSVVRGDAERLAYTFTVSAPNDAAAGKLLDRVPPSYDRTVRREDLSSAARL